MNRQAHISFSERDLPLALILGNGAIVEQLHDVLVAKGCEVILLGNYPKRGKFHYIFQFGNIEDAIGVSESHLKSGGKFIFIDVTDEDVTRFPLTNSVRILRAGNLEEWVAEELIEKILKTIFAAGRIPVIDLRKIHRRSKPILPVSYTATSTKVSEIAEIKKTKSPLIIKRRINKKIYIFFMLPLLTIGLLAIVTYQYIRGVKKTFVNFQNHFSASDWMAVRGDISDARKQLVPAQVIYNITKSILFPFRETQTLRGTGELLTSLENLLNSGEKAISFILTYKNNKQSLFRGKALSGEELAYALTTIETLSKSAANLDSAVSVITLPYFPKEQFRQFVKSAFVRLTTVKQVLPVFEKMFMSSEARSYLVLFQNNMELRPTGGFIGSIGLLTVKNGEISDFKILDVYTADGQLKGHVEPPAPIRKYLEQPNWFLRDSNFDPDFAASAVAAQWFLTKELGISVDGVIGVNLFFVQNLLSAIGPLTLADFNNEIVTSDTLFFKSQLFVQKDFFEGSAQKKDFLTSVASAIQLKIEEAETIPWLEIFSVLYESLEQKNILLYTNDEKTNSLIDQKGWGGRVSDVSCVTDKESCLADYLAVNEANLGVNKANYFVQKSMVLEKIIGTDGTVETILTLSYENKSISEVFAGGPYVNYLRIFVPYGSTISKVTLNNAQLPLSSVDYGTYGNDKTYWGVMVKIAPGNKGVVKFTYKNPERIEASFSTYQLLLQKQGGDKTSPLIISVDSQAITFEPINFTSSSGREKEIYFTSDTSVDRVFILKKKP